MEKKDRIDKLQFFKELLDEWSSTHDSSIRTRINREKAWVKREMIEARCFKTYTIGPPPAVGGLIMRDIDPFEVIFDPPYGRSIIPTICDAVDETIGKIESGELDDRDIMKPTVTVESNYEKGYVFIAMPISSEQSELDDVLDSIKSVCKNCGLNAERIDEVQSNERITDRILESIRKAEFVIVDLSNSRPNVFYEAGYAQGLQKIPIYIARQGTRLEFDLKDYPVIFFNTMRELKTKLEERLRALAAKNET